MNKVILMGRLTRNPDVRYTNSATPLAVARFTLAVDRRFKKEGEQNTDFINCIAFGKQAEFCEKYVKQGIKICCSGRIQTGSYVNKDGSKVYTTDVVMEEIEFAESKANSSNGDNNNTRYNSGNRNVQRNSQENNSNKPLDEEFMVIPEGIEEELPFI